MWHLTVPEVSVLHLHSGIFSLIWSQQHDSVTGTGLKNHVICFVSLTKELFGPIFLALKIKAVPEVSKQKRDTDFHSGENCLKLQVFPMNLWGWKGLNFSQLLWRGRTNFTDYYTPKPKRKWDRSSRSPLVNVSQSFSSISNS